MTDTATLEYEEKRTKRMETIRNLLRRAEGTNSQHEAEACIRKAQEFMILFSVDEEELWQRDPSRKQKIDKQEFNIADKVAGAMQKRIILNTIANLGNCKMWYTPGRHKSYVAGFPSDLLFVEMMYTSIITQMNFQMAMAQAMSTDHHKTFKTNFLDGFSDRITTRLSEMYREATTAVTATGSNALVLRDRKAAVNEWVEEEVGNLKAGKASRSSGAYSHSAQSAGRQAANTTDISGTRRGMNKGAKRLGR